MITDVIIMAGGFGERLWPASSQEHPKQFMTLNGARSFLQESIRRAFALGISGRIVIVTR
ncbi:MAG: mannose-1-phosphate guanylyltransferase, partial [Treponemataceae bacterium]|nr:mannose-1-phosphate guanylyltransferase [Treponemataceae bacterium]